MITSITRFNDLKTKNLNMAENKPAGELISSNPEIKTNNTKLDSKFLHSYLVSFGRQGDRLHRMGNNSNRDLEYLQDNFTPSSENIWEQSAEIAKQYGHNEVTYAHLFKAILENMNLYINDLDSGIKLHRKENLSSVPGVLEEIIDLDLYKDKKKRTQLKQLVSEEIEYLDKILKEKKEVSSDKEPKYQSKLVKEVIAMHQGRCADIENGFLPLTEEILFDAIIEAEGDDDFAVKISEPFITKLEEEFMVDKIPITEKPHIAFFDNKAEDIWKNLALGNNMFLVHDKEANPEHLVNSFVNLLKVQNQQYSNFNKDNTTIFELKKNTSLEFLEKKVEKAKTDPNKNTVIVFNLDDLKENNGVLCETTLEMLKDLPPNVKILVVSSRDKYYSEVANGYYEKLFEDYGDLSLPVLNAEQTKKVFKETPDLMKKIGKNFSQPAIDRCIEYTNSQKGFYPEKALTFMKKSIVPFYIDKEEISLKDVDNYIKESKNTNGLQTSQDNSVQIVFDTKIKLKDLVGQEAAKKEAKSIIDQIKSKNIGTKGLVIYSQDGMPGSGRKYTAQAIAGQAKVPFIPINAYDFGTEKVDLFDVGMLSPEASIRKLYKMAEGQAEANPNKTAVIFIENFEYFAAGEIVSEFHQKAFSELLRQMENSSKSKKVNIVIIGSTSDPDLMDNSAIKSNKFTDQIMLESPSRNVDARYDILNHYIKKNKLKIAGETQEDKDALIKNTAETAEGFPFVYLLRMIEKAKTVAKERNHKLIDKSDFTEAYLQILTGRPSSVKISEHTKQIVTSHECGHATTLKLMHDLAKKQNIPWHLPNKVNFITLDPRGVFGGAMFSKKSENEEFTFEKLFADLVCDFGGHSCEKKFYNIDGSWGISGDMEQATERADESVRYMGLGPNTGKMCIDRHAGPVSAKVQRNIDNDKEILLKNTLFTSDMIVKSYEGFIKEFTERYKDKVGTGDCLIPGEVFEKELENWKKAQPESKQKEFEELDKKILDVIKQTKKGIIVKTELDNKPVDDYDMAYV